jgi:hypothetical protein
MTVGFQNAVSNVARRVNFPPLEGKNRIQNPTRFLARIPILVKPTNSVSEHVWAPSPAAPSIRSRSKKWKKPPD